MTGIQVSNVTAIVAVLALPILVIAIGELEERLRQRDSRATRIVSIVRVWTIPLLTILVVLVGLFTLEAVHPLVRATATAVVLSVGLVALLLLRQVVVWVQDRQVGEGRRGVPQLLLLLPRVAIVIVVFWVLVDTVWGVDLSAALTALGVGSLVISFALQDTLSGLASGLLLLGDSPFQPGDWIATDDVEGEVLDINWRSSRIRTRNGDLIVVPNAQLAGATVTNYSQPDRAHRVVVEVQVAFVNPPTVARQMLLAAARETPHVLEEPPPAVVVTQTDDPLMGYAAHMWIDDYGKVPAVESEFRALVWYQSERQGVPLPSPAFDLFHFEGQAAGQAVTAAEELVARLRRSALLAQLDDHDLSELASHARTERYADGEVILTGEDAGGDLYLIWEGGAELVVRSGELSVVAANLSAGEIFGNVQVDIGASQLAVVADGDCDVVAVPQSTAGEVTSRVPDLAAALNRLSAMRTRRIEQALER